MKSGALVALFTMFSTSTLHGVDRSKDYVDWPIVESSQERTPALQARADKSSIQFQIGTGFDVGTMGSDPGKSQGYQCTTPFDQRCIDQRSALVSSQRWKSLNQLPICLADRESTPCIENIVITEASGGKNQLRVAGTVPGYQWPANQKYGSPAGALSQIWKGEQDIQDTGYVLAAQVNVQGFYNKSNSEIIDFKTNIFRFEFTPLNDPYLVANKRTFCLWIDNSTGQERYIDEDRHVSTTQTSPHQQNLD
jgi:hypothetical protein